MCSSSSCLKGAIVLAEKENIRICIREVLLLKFSKLPYRRQKKKKKAPYPHSDVGVVAWLSLLPPHWEALIRGVGIFHKS